MNFTVTKHALAWLLVLPGLLAAVTGCASMAAHNDEPLLSAAGFVARPPETSQQRKFYAEAPAYEVGPVHLKGKVSYGYKDEQRGIAYVGDEVAYQRYRQFAAQRRIAQTDYAIAMTNQSVAHRWSGAGKPTVFGPRAVVPQPTWAATSPLETTASKRP